MLAAALLISCETLSTAQNFVPANQPAEIYIGDNITTGRTETRYLSLTSDTGVPCGELTHTAPPDNAALARQPHSKFPHRAATGEGCTATGTQNVAVIVANFPGQRPPAITNSALQQLLFANSGDSLTTYYNQVSNNQLSLTGSVFGPYTLDRSYSCDETVQMRAAAIRASDRDIDFTRFQRFILVFPQIAGCWFGGLSSIGCVELQSTEGRTNASWIWMNFITPSGAFLNLLAHEFGHSLGVGHARMLRFPGVSIEADDFRAVPFEYGDPSSIMGSGRLTTGFDAAHQYRLGWLAPDQGATLIEQDSDITLRPIDKHTGARALRVRRNARPGVTEFLWIEHRSPGSDSTALGGVLVRRDPLSPEEKIDLLDMTPVSLEDAAFFHSYVSEQNPELRPNTTWIDPHSDLTITTGDPTGDGIPVSIRYTQPCATPATRELTLPAGDQEATIEVATTGEDCEWNVLTGRTWITAAKSAPNQVTLKLAAATDTFHRTGVVTIGRQTVTIRQRGPESNLEITSVSLPGPDIAANAPMPLLFTMRDQNGVDDMQTVYINVRPQPPSAAASCYFRYTIASRALETSDDGDSYSAAPAPNPGSSGACAATAVHLIADSTTQIVRLEFRLAADDGEQFTF